MSKFQKLPIIPKKSENLKKNDWAKPIHIHQRVMKKLGLPNTLIYSSQRQFVNN